ncbi:MBL fold metallo-hydrolase [Aquabacterium soli]|uniref:MBL fold metallo-hydrolase n=1 Tax=Aquabacterium soli TaxID=2493092 RepID=A0A426VGP2_9BURK|nr:MBL fold metallo-hydrolase [Aquabacterium soli]
MTKTTSLRPPHLLWKRAGWAVLGLILLLALGCGLISAGDHKLPVGPELAGLATFPAAQPPQGLAFTTLQTSQSNGAAEALIVAGGRWWVHRRPVQVAVLVRHPKGQLLFDTGLGRQVDAQFAGNNLFHRQVFAYERGGRLPVADQLQRQGWPLKDIKMIVPSHMHWDHISGLPDFPDAEVWATPAEREEAGHAHAPAFLRSQFDGVKHWRELRFEGPPVLGFAHSHDVFGDGSVLLLPLGGHTAGQVGMLLSLPSGQCYLFTGDVTWAIEGFHKPADRSWLLRRILPLDHDPAANQAAIVHIHQLMKRHPGITVVPAHDENVLKSLPHFPELRN